MLGLIFTILTYGLVTVICFLIKTLTIKLKKSKKVTATQPSKIYYITNDQKRKKRVRKTPDIAIKGSIIDEINQEDSMQ